MATSSPALTPSHLRAIVAASVGNALEWLVGAVVTLVTFLQMPEKVGQPLD